MATTPEPETGGGFSNAKTVLVVAIVMGCFAVLYPKIFYPMLFETSYNAKPKSAPDYHDMHRPPDRPNFGPHPGMRGPGGSGGDQARPMFMGEEGKHFRRTLEKDLRPGPVPGMRPSMGGPGVQPQASTKGQGGAMGILMPIYSIGIVIFFVYTIMKLIFKNKDEEGGGNDKFSKIQQQQHYQQQLRSRQIQQEREQQLQLAAQQYQQQLQRKSHVVVEPLPIIPEQSTRDNLELRNKSSAPPAAFCPPPPEPEVTKEAVGLNDRENVVESVTPPPPADDQVTERQSPVQEKLNDPRDEEILKLRKKLEETERMMQAFMTQVSSSIPSANPNIANEMVDDKPLNDSSEIVKNDRKSDADDDDEAGNCPDCSAVEGVHPKGADDVVDSMVEVQEGVAQGSVGHSASADSSQVDGSEIEEQECGVEEVGQNHSEESLKPEQLETLSEKRHDDPSELPLHDSNGPDSDNRGSFDHSESQSTVLKNRKKRRPRKEN